MKKYEKNRVGRRYIKYAMFRRTMIITIFRKSKIEEYSCSFGKLNMTKRNGNFEEEKEVRWYRIKKIILELLEDRKKKKKEKEKRDLCKKC